MGYLLASLAERCLTEPQRSRNLCAGFGPRVRILPLHGIRGCQLVPEFSIAISKSRVQLALIGKCLGVSPESQDTRTEAWAIFHPGNYALPVSRFPLWFQMKRPLFIFLPSSGDTFDFWPGAWPVEDGSLWSQHPWLPIRTKAVPPCDTPPPPSLGEVG